MVKGTRIHCAPTLYCCYCDNLNIMMIFKVGLESIADMFITMCINALMHYVLA